MIGGTPLRLLCQIFVNRFDGKKGSRTEYHHQNHCQCHNTNNEKFRNDSHNLTSAVRSNIGSNMN